jgi:hypothetical protein
MFFQNSHVSLQDSVFLNLFFSPMKKKIPRMAACVLPCMWRFGGHTASVAPQEPEGTGQVQDTLIQEQH